MSKKFRDYLFLAFIACFIIGTTLISLYASGYKFNLAWPPRFNRLLIKTGMIAVDSAPRGAIIYLNGRPVKNFSLNPWSKEYLTTGAKIKNVLPGEYELKLERTGYWPLSKKINVYSGQTTFAEDINLFRQDLPYLLVESADTPLNLSPNHKYLYASTAGRIITLKDRRSRDLPVKETGVWLENQDRLFVAGRLFNPETSEDLDYTGLIGPDATDWHYDESGDRLYYRSRGSLAYLDIGDRTIHSLPGGAELLAYEPRGGKLFAVRSENNRTVLTKYALTDQKTEQQLVLPNVGHYRFQSDGRPNLALYDDQNKTLYLIDPDNLAGGLRTINNINSWAWLDDNTLLYNNNWEIYLFDLQQNKAALLTRMGEELRDLLWNDRNNYLVFSTADSLNTYDLKIGLSTKIFRAAQVGPPVLDEKSGTLYFWAKVGQQAGVYSLLLQ
ncbi:MAG: hypothetical protein WC453_03520 [Patescibacteria group bacterium]